MKRGRKDWPRRATRRRLSVAEMQMQLAAGRSLVLPEGADPELEMLMRGRAEGCNGEERR